MDPLRVWPDFDDAWVVYEDEDLIAVDKPAFMPSQAADEARPDDLVTRLRAWLTARGVGGSYLGVHQRLDRDTSGVVVMTRRKEANASIARQFEGRAAEKPYLAGVTGWRAGRKTATLTTHSGRGRTGTMAVVPARDREGAARRDARHLAPGEAAAGAPRAHARDGADPPGEGPARARQGPDRGGHAVRRERGAAADAARGVGAVVHPTRRPRAARRAAARRARAVARAGRLRARHLRR